MEIKVNLAKEDDKKEILELYKSLLGTKQCFWDEYYPNEDTINFDISRDSLFVFRDGEKDNLLVAAISIDLDEEVETLDCWSDELQPAAELSRLAVRSDYQSKGIGRMMMLEAMKAAKDKGYKAVHYLVHRDNIKAQRSYKEHNFVHVGECELFEMPFLCFEKEL